MGRSRLWLVGVGLAGLACGSPSGTSETETRATEASTGTGSSTSAGTETDTSTSETGGDPPCEVIELGLGSPPIHVAFVVERSMYMAEDYGGLTRFDAIGEALFGQPEGLAWVFEDEALGLFTYGSLDDTCPTLTTTAIEPGNTALLESLFAGLAPGGSSPAANAITAAAEAFAAPGTIIVLSGHNPTSCVSDSLQASVFETREAAAVAFEAGIESRFVEVGDVADGYAQALANIGVGLPPGGPESAPWWSPADVDQLRAALVSIFAGLRGCVLTTKGAQFVEGGELECELEIAGQVVELEGADGWAVAEPGVFELSGAACEAYRAGASAALACPCESVL